MKTSKLFLIILFVCAFMFEGWNSSISSTNKINEIKYTKSLQTLGNMRSFGVDIDDVDMDGDRDVFLCNYLGPSKLWLNDGLGKFYESSQNFGNMEAHDVAIHDLNGDGYSDIFLLNHAAPSKVYFNNGAGTFVASTQGIGTSTDYPYTLLLGDIDNDRDKDAFISYAYKSTRLWINDGTGHFTPTETDYGKGLTMELADVNADGFLDLFLTLSNLPDEIWMNDGHGNFTNSGQHLGDSIGYNWIDGGDIDNDGDVEFVVTNTATGITIWHNQNRTGTFIKSGADFGLYSYRCYLFDADGDGDLDLISNPKQERAVIWMNDGRGNYDSVCTMAENKKICSIACEDIDGDKDYDVVFGQGEGTGGNSIYFNETTIDSIENAYLNQTPPDSIPLRFSPDSLLANDQWFWHGSPSFSPDLKEMYWIKYLKAYNRTEIAYTKLVDNIWTTPERPAFASNTYRENNPIFSITGDTLYFLSSRPGGPFFRTIRQNDTSWSQHVSFSVPKPSNLNFGLQFVIAKNGTIYFELEGQIGLDIYRSKLVNGAYSHYEILGNSINSNGNDFTPWIHPDEKYLIFSSDRSGGYGDFDLYISFQNNDSSWTQPQNLGNLINTSGTEVWPHLSPDNKYLFFVSERTGDSGYNPYWISTKFIDKLLPATHVRDGMGSLPTKIKLYPNYPNPFNPSTIIHYQLPVNGYVSLKVYDVLGKGIATLVDGIQSAGYKSIEFDANGLPSGIYLYKLQADKFLATKKMILMK